MNASRYTHGHHESVLRSHRWRTAENSAGYLLPYLRDGLSVLDVGCGPGTLTMDLAERVSPGRVTAIEPTAAALDLARQEAARRGTQNVDFVVGDVHRLGFADASFDVVHAHQVLQHLPDPVQALRECWRVCRPGGIVAARDGDYKAFTWYPADPDLNAWLDLYRRIARANGGEPDAGRRLLAWAHEAGFVDVHPSADVWCFATAQDRAYWGGMWADRILHSALAEQAVAEGWATAEELQAFSDAWRRWTNTADGWLATLHGEVICRTT